MANVALFRTGETPQYLVSVHTPLYSSDPDAIINPDVTALAAVPLHYWKRSGNSVLEMTVGEKAAVDSALASAALAARRAAAEAAQASADVEGIRLRAEISVLLDEINILRGTVVTTTWDPANMANATGVTSPNIAVTGAAFGDMVNVAAPYTVAGVTVTGFVVSAGNVAIRLHNGTGAAVNLASGIWTVQVVKVGAPRTLAQARTAYTNKVNTGAAD